jgi:hypothetical protein
MVRQILLRYAATTPPPPGQRGFTRGRSEGGQREEIDCGRDSRQLGGPIPGEVVVGFGDLKYRMLSWQPIPADRAVRVDVEKV